MSALTLRPPRGEDAAALAALGRDSFVAAFGHLYSSADLTAFLDEVHGDEAIVQELSDPTRRYCLAETDGQLAGYCKLGMICGWPDYARGTNTIELKQLYTAPGMTGMGTGAALMDWALGEARGFAADEVQLSVWSGNHGAQRFYARYGFAKVADITFVVGAQIDEEFLFARLL